MLGLRWGLGCWQWHRVGGRPEDDEVGGVDPAESTFCPDPIEDGDGVVGFVGVLTLLRSSHVRVALLRELCGRCEGGDELGAHGPDGGVECGGGNGRG